MNVSWGAVSILGGAIIPSLLYVLWPSQPERKRTKKASDFERRDYIVVFPPGLTNVRNFCFLNSTLQALASLPELIEYLRALLNTVHCAPEHWLHFDQTLLDLLLQLNELNSYHKNLNAYSIIAALQQQNNGVSRSLGYVQEDAHEFFQMVASIISETHSNLALPPSPSLLDVGKTPLCRSAKKLPRCPLMGLTVSVVNCATCGHYGKLRHNVISQLSLVAPAFSSATLEEMIEDFIEPSAIEGMRCDYCSLVATRALVENRLALVRAQVDVENTTPLRKRSREMLLARLQTQFDDINASLQHDPEAYMEDKSVPKPLVKRQVVYSKLGYQQTLLSKCPTTLVIHISRSVVLPSGHVGRNPCRVRFDLELDLAPYSTVNQRPNSAENVYFMPYKSSFWSQKQIKRPVSNDSGPAITEKYRLNACVMHYGGHDSGHFVCYRRLETQKKSYWVYVSDTTVLRVSDPEKEIFNNGQSDVYMLFYSKLV